jgi:hypothetical protein
MPFVAGTVYGNMAYSLTPLFSPWHRKIPLHPRPETKHRPPHQSSTKTSLSFVKCLALPFLGSSVFVLCVDSCLSVVACTAFVLRRERLPHFGPFGDWLLHLFLKPVKTPVLQARRDPFLFLPRNMGRLDWPIDFRTDTFQKRWELPFAHCPASMIPAKLYWGRMIGMTPRLEQVATFLPPVLSWRLTS